MVGRCHAGCRSVWRRGWEGLLGPAQNLSISVHWLAASEVINKKSAYDSIPEVQYSGPTDGRSPACGWNRDMKAYSRLNFTCAGSLSTPSNTPDGKAHISSGGASPVRSVLKWCLLGPADLGC